VKNKNQSELSRHFLCLELLNACSEKEIEDLSHFVSCSCFNTDKKIIQLLDALKRSVLGRKKFTEEMQIMVYNKVFSDSLSVQNLSLTQKKLFNAKLNILTRLTEQFLVIRGLDEHKAYRNDILYKKLLEKRQFWLFNRHMKKNQKALKLEAEQGIEYYEYQWRTGHNMLNYLHRSGLLGKEDNLSDLIYNLDVYYLLHKLGLQMTLLSVKEATQKTYDRSDFKALSHLLDLPQYKSHPLIRVYQVTVQLMETKREDIYRELLLLLDIHTIAIPKDHLNGLYTVATNFCTQQIKSGQFTYRDLFELYQVMDVKNLLVENDFMPELKLKNIVIAACRVGDFASAGQSVEQYYAFIRKSVRESVYHLNLGVIDFYQNDYKAALHHFIRVEPVNLNYDINCRVLMLKSYYETDEEYDERTMQIFRSTEKFFNENKSLSSKDKKGYKNFIRTLINIYRVRHQTTRMDIKRIREKLEQQEVNSDKHWLLGKIKEIKI